MEERKKGFNAIELVPEGWDLGLGAIPEDILFLGEGNITQMIRAWRREEQKKGKAILRIGKMIRTLNKKDRNSPCEGCEFAAPDRYGELFLCPCEIQRELEMNEEENRFSNCFIGNESPEKIETMIVGLREKIGKLLEEKKEVTRKIISLDKIRKMKSCEQKPILSLHRPSDHFSPESRVRIFIKESGEFVTATVMLTFRHNGEDVVCTKNSTTVRNLKSPEIILEDDYKYLKNNRGFARWLWAGFVPAAEEPSVVKDFFSALFSSTDNA